LPDSDAAQLSNALQQNDWAAAKIFCERILDRSPQDPDALHALGVVCWSEGNTEAAARYLASAVQSNPTAGWYNNLGALQIILGRWSDAIGSLRQAVNLDPDALYCRVHLAIALCGAREPLPAIEILGGVLEREPANCKALETLGRAYRMAGREPEAYRVLSRAADLCPDSDQIRLHLADACLGLRRVEEARRHALRLTELAPGAASFVRLAIASWHTNDRKEALKTRDLAFTFGLTDPVLHSALLLMSLFDERESEASLFRWHRLWALTHSPTPERDAAFINDPNPDRKLRIGFVAAQLYNSPAERFQVPLIRSLDRTQFDPFVYLLSTEPPLRNEAPAVHRSLIGRTDEEAAEIICSDSIDILVDCSGHQSHGRLRIFGLRPAPVQVVRSGYPCTTGLRSVEAFFTDAVLTPEGTDAHYSEPLVRMPGGAFLYEPPMDAPEVEAFSRRRHDFITFGVFQQTAKLNEINLRLMAAVLQGVEDSRILFQHHNTSYEDPESRDIRWIRGVFTEAGVCADRMDFAGPRRGVEYLNTISGVDMALDTLPFSGHATTCDCLWMGVPVVTQAGNTFAGRVSASLLAQVELSDLTAKSEAQFIEIATALANDPGRLQAVRASLRDRMAKSSLTDIQGRAREFEQECRRLWRAWCSTATASS